MDEEKKRYHFIGIGGIGMSALARILLDKQMQVSGSDLSTGENTSALSKRGATIQRGHAAKYIPQGATVVYSTGIVESNPEYQEALTKNCQMLHRSQLLAQLMEGYDTLAVTGTHGKTSVSALLVHVLIEAGLDPTFAVGGMLEKKNGALGRGRYFVAEADESDGSFLHYHPKGAIITNIEPEHMEYFKTKEALYTAFTQFFAQVKDPELLFYCGDDLVLASLSKGRGWTYGFGADNSIRILNTRQMGWAIRFDLEWEGKIYADISLALIGDYNALNAAAVFVMALRLGVDEMVIRRAMESFPGIARRCEKRSERGGVLFLDDYAHHPTELAVTLRAVKEAIGERRLVVVFQPHRYTRTRDHFDRWTTALERADHLFITEIYPAGEEPIEGISAKALVDKFKEETTLPCHYLKETARLEEHLQPHDVVLTIGAGDITHLHKHNFSPKKLHLGVLYGGASCEHEISLLSARFVAASLNQEIYKLHYFGIDKHGNWVCGHEAEEILSTCKSVVSPAALPFLHPEVTGELQRCDLFLPILHGTYGEDGTIQGFFEMLNKPYVGPDYRSAAIAMDKTLTKRLVAAAGVLTPKDHTFEHRDWLTKKSHLIEVIKGELTLPVYVKPVHLGSSVGVHFVADYAELEEAIEAAFRYDSKVMVEEGVVKARELEFAVLGQTVPPPGEKLSDGEFVDYEKKYGEAAISTTIEPDLTPELIRRGKELALKAYNGVGCSGMCRVDFLLDQEGNFWFFEMNPIPGLQPKSLFPKIWRREGLSGERLVDRLIVLALERRRQQQRHHFPFYV